jgi:hypothetical protein
VFPAGPARPGRPPVPGRTQRRQGSRAEPGQEITEAPAEASRGDDDKAIDPVAVAAVEATAGANRRLPSRRHPGRPAAAPNTAPIAVSANRPAPVGGVTAAPPSSTARTQRTKLQAVVYRTAALCAAGRTPHPPPAISVSTMPTVSAKSSCQTGVHAGSSP